LLKEIKMKTKSAPTKAQQKYERIEEFVELMMSNKVRFHGVSYGEPGGHSLLFRNTKNTKVYNVFIRDVISS
jgi:hypothetical protein